MSKEDIKTIYVVVQEDFDSLENHLSNAMIENNVGFFFTVVDAENFIKKEDASQQKYKTWGGTFPRWHISTIKKGD